MDNREYHTIQEVKNGLGPAPIKTPEGWLHLAHGVRNTAAGLRYVLYLFLAELERPWVITHKPAGYFIAPEGAERVGDVSNVVFSNGWIERKNGDVLIYYASSDTQAACGNQHREQTAGLRDEHACRSAAQPRLCGAAICADREESRGAEGAEAAAGQAGSTAKLPSLRVRKSDRADGGSELLSAIWGPDSPAGSGPDSVCFFLRFFARLPLRRILRACLCIAALRRVLVEELARDVRPELLEERAEPTLGGYR